MTQEITALFDRLEAAAAQSVVGLTPPDLYDTAARLRRAVEKEINRQSMSAPALPTAPIAHPV